MCVHLRGFWTHASNFGKRKFFHTESSQYEELFLQDLTHRVEYENSFAIGASDNYLNKSKISVNAMDYMPKRHKIDTNQSSTSETKKNINTRPDDSLQILTL